MKLLLADDHALFRDALVHYIQRTNPETIVSTARDLHEAMETMESDPSFDIILLDFRMPGMNGLEGLEKLNTKYPDTPIALISGVIEPAYVEKAIDMGAKAYFPKTLSGKALLNAIEQVLQGETYIATNHNNDKPLPAYYDDNNSDPVNISNMNTNPNLTPREYQVLSYLLLGASNKEIANELKLQVVTVKLHVRGICQKLGAKNRTQAALKAKELNIHKQSSHR